MDIIKPRGRFAGQEVIDQTRKHLEPAELVRVFQALRDDPFWYGYFRLQYWFGMRVSEVALILKEDVSFEDRMVLVRRLKKRQRPFVTVEVDGKKRRRADPSAAAGAGYQEQVYGLPEKLVPVLWEVKLLVDRSRPAANPWFFASPGAQVDRAAAERMANIRRVGGWRAVSRSAADLQFRRAALAGGVPRRLAHTHVLRHTRATLMLAEGVVEEDVRFLLGHSSIATTRRYLGVAQQLRLRAQNSAELALGDLGGSAPSS